MSLNKRIMIKYSGPCFRISENSRVIIITKDELIENTFRSRIQLRIHAITRILIDQMYVPTWTNETHRRTIEMVFSPCAVSNNHQFSLLQKILLRPHPLCLRTGSGKFLDGEHIVEFPRLSTQLPRSKIDTQR